MRRPLALAGFSLLCTNLLCLLWGTTFAMVCAAILLAILLFFLFIKNNNHWVQSLRGCCFFCLCGCLLFSCLWQTQVKPLTPLVNTTKYTEFTVLEEAGEYEDTHYYLVSAKGCYPNNPQKECKLRLSVTHPHQLQPGQVAGGMVSFSLPASYRYTANGIYLTGSFAQEASPTLLGTKQTLRSRTAAVRDAISQKLSTKGTGDTFALVKGICLGDAHTMSKKTQQDFYSCGLGHLVAVSGLHTNQVGAVFIALFLFIAKQKRFVKLFSLLFVWSFVLLTGFSFSSLRAAIMFSFFAVGSSLFRKPDSLNTLGGAVTFILLCNPFAVSNVGFLASVSACLGLVLWATPITHKLTSLLPISWQSNSICAFMINGISATLAATIGTIPCNFLAFRSLSLVSPITNILCVPLATFILIFGFLGVLLCYCSPFAVVGNLLLWLAHGLASFILKVASFFGKIPYHNLVQGTPIAFAVFAIGGICILWFIYKRQPVLKKGISMVIIMLLCCGILFSCFLPAFGPNTAEFCFLANQYDGALVAVQGKTAVFIGCSMTNELEEYLLSRGIDTIALWVIPSRSNPTTAFTTMAQQFNVKEILINATEKHSGVLSAWDKMPPVSSSLTKQAGSFLITAHSSFCSFVITFGETSLYYADTKTHHIKPYSYGFTNRKANNAQTHHGIYQGEEITLTTTTAFRITKNKATLYHPEFVF